MVLQIYRNPGESSAYSSRRPTEAQSVKQNFYRRLAVAISIVLMGTPANAQGVPANSLRDLWAMFNVCIKAPGEPVGSDMTIVFSLKRNGQLLGRPRISHAHLVGDPGAQKLFVARSIAALGRCLPAHVTDALGGAIAGRPFSIRLIARPVEKTAVFIVKTDSIVSRF